MRVKKRIKVLIEAIRNLDTAKLEEKKRAPRSLGTKPVV
jgi:hypothetical protein